MNAVLAADLAFAVALAAAILGAVVLDVYPRNAAAAALRRLMGGADGVAAGDTGELASRAERDLAQALARRR